MKMAGKMKVAMSHMVGARSVQAINLAYELFYELRMKARC